MASWEKKEEKEGRTARGENRHHSSTGSDQKFTVYQYFFKLSVYKEEDQDWEEVKDSER